MIGTLQKRIQDHQINRQMVLVVKNSKYNPDKGEQFATFYNMLLRAEDAEERETVKRKTADWKKYLELHRIKTARELDCDRSELQSVEVAC